MHNFPVLFWNPYQHYPSLLPSPHTYWTTSFSYHPPVLTPTLPASPPQVLPTAPETTPSECCKAEEVKADISSSPISCKKVGSSKFSSSKKKKAAPPRKRKPYKLHTLIMKVLNYVTKSKPSGRLCSEIFQHYSGQLRMGWCTARYYTFMSLLKGGMCKYESLKALSQLIRVRHEFFELFREDEQRFYLKTARVMMHHFCTNVLHLSVLGSTRISQDKRQIYLSSRRKLIDTIQGL